MEIYEPSVSSNDMLAKKNPKQMHANLTKYQVENCSALPGRNLISTCNRRVKSVSAGRVEISSRQARIAITTLLTSIMVLPIKKILSTYIALCLVYI